MLRATPSLTLRLASASPSPLLCPHWRYASVSPLWEKGRGLLAAPKCSGGGR